MLLQELVCLRETLQTFLIPIYKMFFAVLLMAHWGYRPCRREANLTLFLTVEVHI